MFIQVVNYVIQQLLMKLALYEKHFTFNSLNASLTSKLTYLQFLNTALLAFILKILSQDQFYTYKLGKKQ